MGELVHGRQVAAARILANVTQEALAAKAGLHVNSVRYVERQPRVTTGYSAELIENALLALGVVLFSFPTPGARLVDRAFVVEQQSPVRDLPMASETPTASKLVAVEQPAPLADNPEWITY